MTPERVCRGLNPSDAWRYNAKAVPGGWIELGRGAADTPVDPMRPRTLQSIPAPRMMA